MANILDGYRTAARRFVISYTQAVLRREYEHDCRVTTDESYGAVAGKGVTQWRTL